MTSDRDIVKRAMADNGWTKREGSGDHIWIDVERWVDSTLYGSRLVRVDMQFSASGRLIRAWSDKTGTISRDKRKRILEVLNG